jgi:hypothetical protein
MRTPFTGKVILLAVFYIAFWALIGLLVDGPTGMAPFASALGPVFAVAGTLLIAHDLHPWDKTAEIAE